jgi:hypothetical protein
MNNASLFTDLDQTLERATPREAVDRLCLMLKNKGDFHALFDALLLQARLKLGLPAVLSQAGDELTPEQRAAYETEVRNAARTIGGHFLGEKNILGAWPYYRMINEPAPIAEALDKYDTVDDDDTFPAILDISIQEGANPERGFALLLKRFGLCSAITALGQSFPYTGVIRQKAISRLVDSISSDLRDRLAAHSKELTGTVPPDTATIREILKGSDQLTGEDGYHVDISHLASIVQYALELPPGEASKKVIELCEYGAKLSTRLQPSSEPPFENGYRDYLVYFKALNGSDVEDGLAHFRLKAESVENGQEQTAPAEVYVHLLASLGRHKEALGAYSRYLTQAEPRRLACPPAQELARRSGDYESLAELSLRRGDAVTYAAAKAVGAKAGTA